MTWFRKREARPPGCLARGLVPRDSGPRSGHQRSCQARAGGALLPCPGARREDIGTRKIPRAARVSHAFFSIRSCGTLVPRMAWARSDLRYFSRACVAIFRIRKKDNYARDWVLIEELIK